MNLKDKKMNMVGGSKNYYFGEKDVKKSVNDMYEYMDIALDELEDFNNEDTLNISNIRDNQKELKIFEEILKKSIEESPDWCKGLGNQ